MRKSNPAAIELSSKLGLPEDLEAITVHSDGIVTMRSGSSNNTATFVLYGTFFLSSELDLQRERFVKYRAAEKELPIAAVRAQAPWMDTYMSDRDILAFLQSKNLARQEAIDVLHKVLPEPTYTRGTIERYSRERPSGRGKPNTPARKKGRRR
jgi:hypothetical protein